MRLQPALDWDGFSQLPDAARRMGERRDGSALLRHLGGTLAWMWQERWFLMLVAAIAVVDGVLLGLDLAHRYAMIEGTPLPFWFSLSEDGSFGELFEYGLTGSAAVVMALAARRSRSPLRVVAALLLFWLTLDNALQFHESGGRLLASLLPPADLFGARTQDLGELAILALVGLVLLGGTAWALHPGWPRADLPALLVIALAAASGFFGAGVDLLHAMVNHSSAVLGAAFGLIEDLGELVLLSLSAATAWSLYRRDRRDAPFPGRASRRRRSKSF